MAYIDEKKVKRKLQYIFKVYGISEVIKSKINKALADCTADVVEVKHGEWEQVKKHLVAVNPYEHRCGLCGKAYFDHNKFNYPYCPNCGAKTDEKALKEREKE